MVPAAARHKSHKFNPFRLKRNQRNRELRDPAKLSHLWEICGADTTERQQQVTDVVDLFRGDQATFLQPRAGELKSDTDIDITHESLIWGWKDLRNWTRDERRQAN